MTLRSPFRIALAAALGALALAIIALWKIGPVVATLTATHGVHAGDFLAAVPALAGVAVVALPRWLPELTAERAPA